MRRRLLIGGLAAAGAAGLAAVWAGGGFEALAAWAADGQRQFQGAMARSLRALKGGEPGAVATLLGLCFAYGFVHAVGPGHGKILIGGYGVGRRVPMGRLAGLAVASSLAQALTAVALVYGGVFLFQFSREQMTDMADTTLQTVSAAAIGAIGLWLVWRGVRGFLRRLGRSAPADRTHGHAHDHDHDHAHGHEHAPHTHPVHAADAAEQGMRQRERGVPAAGLCDTCGHAHGPSLEQAEAVRSWRDAVAVVAGIAVRPCTGALFLLILTWRLEIDAIGIAGAFAMALGTAAVTVAVAVASVSLREGAFMALANGRGVGVLVPALELAAGALIAGIAAQLLLRGF